MNDHQYILWIFVDPDILIHYTLYAISRGRCPRNLRSWGLVHEWVQGPVMIPMILWCQDDPRCTDQKLIPRFSISKEELHLSGWLKLVTDEVSRWSYRWSMFIYFSKDLVIWHVVSRLPKWCLASAKDMESPGRTLLLGGKVATDAAAAQKLSQSILIHSPI